ncbi:MAG: serine/threonine-protein kinase [Actinomycetota bacterium]|nr:serine/threonine-protein kinase [Actinomycetota bacterium]
MEQLLGGRYELRAHLGRGGFASVVVAHDQRLRRDVAVKLLSPNAGPGAGDRFVREAHVAASINHPNVVVVHDVGVEGDQPYLVMELLEGGDLSSVIAQRAPLSLGETTHVMSSVLAALDALHRAGIVHRDVKPANILVTTDGTVKLSDFGIARPTDATRLTAAGSVLGTPAYLPPEQAEGRPATASGDLYSAGAVLYELLTGEPPFGRGSTAGVALAHVREPVPTVRSMRPEMSAELDEVVRRALAKDPMERWPDAAAMGAAVHEATRGHAPTPVLPAAVAASADRATAHLSPSGYEPTGLPGARTPPSPGPPPPSGGEPEQATAYLAASVVSGTDRTRAPVDEPRPTVPDVPAYAARRAGGADATRAYAHSPEAAPDGPRGRRAPLLIALAVLALCLLGALALLNDGDEAPDQVAAGPSTTTAATTEPAPTSTVTPTTTAAPTTLVDTVAVIATSGTLEELIGALSADPGAAGERGGELLDGLEKVADHEGRKQRDAAEDTLRDIETWIDEGQLDPTIGSIAIDLVAPFAAEPAEPAGDDDDDEDEGPGRGQGRGNDD